MKRVDGFMRALICVLVALFVAGAAYAGPPVGADQGVAKWVEDADGQFFFLDVDGDLLWTPATDAKFRIQGGTITCPTGPGMHCPLVNGDFSGNGQTQVGLMTETKVYVESGNFSWTPASDTGDLNFFFAPNVGLVQSLVGDWALQGADSIAKVGTDQFIFVDANGNNAWNGQPTDAKFRIQGGTETGIYFVIDRGAGPRIGLLTANKYFIDENGDYAWTPGAGTELDGFFAPNVGTVEAVLIADFNGDSMTEFAKIAGGFIWVDRNGNLAWDGDTIDGKYRIQGGSLIGPHFAGNFLGNTNASVGQFDSVKLYVDGNASNAPDDGWTPGAGTETVNFYAPNTGNLQAAATGRYGAP